MWIPVKNNSSVTKSIAGITIDKGFWNKVPEEEARRFVNFPDLEFKFSDKLDKDVLCYGTPFSYLDGYGIAGINILLELDKRGIKTYPVLIGWERPAFLPERVKELSEIYKDSVPEWGVCHGIPVELDCVPARKVIMWTMWESDKLPYGWTELINNKAAALFVPSKYQIELFKNNGVNVPIYVVPDSVDDKVFTYYDRPQRDTFTFACWAKMTSRKCPIELLECFWKAFPNEEDVRLVIKTHHKQFGGGKLGGIPNVKDPRITIYDSGGDLPDWSTEEMVKLAHNADCGIFLSTGEGFYDGPVEAMMTGLPVIIPSHTGPLDYNNEEYNYPVRTSHVEDSPMGPEMKWWVMDYDHVVERMREVYECRNVAKEKGKKAAKWVRSLYTPEKVADIFISNLEDAKTNYVEKPIPVIHKVQGGMVNDVSVLYLAHNQVLLNRETLFRLLTCRDKGFELILIDNDSTDGTKELFDDLVYSRKIVIHNSSNLSFAEANNKAFQLSTGDYILLLNNDCYVNAGCISAMRNAFDIDEKIGVVGARLLYPGGSRVQHGGGFIKGNQIGHLNYRDSAYNPETLKSKYVDWVTGACMMIKRDLFDLDTRFTAGGFEDVDLCLRVKEKGYKVWYEASAVAEHKESASYNKQERFKSYSEMRKLFFDKWDNNENN
jgi:GT2 family glycosyltransferase/glycosyltransferase involved in cell wall biosynthesis